MSSKLERNVGISTVKPLSGGCVPPPRPPGAIATAVATMRMTTAAKMLTRPGAAWRIGRTPPRVSGQV